MKEINNGKQMKDVWQFTSPKKIEKEFGKHPTQKPLEILKWIVKSSSKPKHVVLDCFMGSGTTAIACVELNRNFIGCELNSDFHKISQNKLKEIKK